MGTGKKKIEIKRKEKEADRLVAFSKRRKGLFKKAHELHSLSGAHVAVLVFSPAGKIYIHGDPCFEDTVDNFLHYAATATATTTTSAANPVVTGSCDHAYDDHAMFEDIREIEACKPWLEMLDVDSCDDVNDLVAVKNDLEQFRDKVIRRFGGVADLTRVYVFAVVSELDTC